MLRFDDEYPDDRTQKTNFLHLNHENSAKKHSIEKHILLNFLNLSTMFCPRLSEETHFHL